MIRLMALGVALLVASAITATVPDPKPVSAATVSVSAENYQYSPRDVTIAAGDTVQWNFSGFTHDVKSSSGNLLESGDKNDGQTFSFQFDTPGTYNYYCSYHGSPDGTGMAGSVTVTGAATSTSTVVSGTATATRTRTPTRTPTAVGTVSATATGTPTAFATVGIASPTSTPQLISDDNLPPGGGAQPAQVRPPETGDGSSGANGSGWHWLSIALAAAGAGAIAGVPLVRKRAPR